jgi:hypothetical protein
MKTRALTFTAAALLSLSPAAGFAQSAAPPPPAAPGAPAAPAAPATPATTAAPAGEADAHFRRGVDLYKETDYAAALIEFRRAYELEPRYQALYNIAETHYQLTDYASALRAFEKYLHDGGAQIAPGRRDEVQKEIEKLRTRVATLEVTANLPDVDIAVDDLSVGKTPLAAPLMVSAGRRKLTATRAGKPPITQIVELAGGDIKKVALVVPDDGGAPEAAPAGRVPVVPWVITGVLAAGAVVTGALALGASSAVNSDRGTLSPNPTELATQLSSDHNKTVALAATTDVLIGSAAVAGIVSIYFTATAGRRKPADEKSAPRASLHSVLSAVHEGGSAPSLRLQAGPQSVVLSGTF